MEIVQNSNGILTVKCYDRKYPIGKKIEWFVKVGEGENREIKSTNSDNAIASINLSWKDDLKLGKRNSIRCVVKTHPHTHQFGNWHEKTAWIYEEDVLKFCECGDCGTKVPESTNAIAPENKIQSNNNNKIIIIASSLSSVILILSVMLSFYYFRKRQQRNTARNNGKQGRYRTPLSNKLLCPLFMALMYLVMYLS